MNTSTPTEACSTACVFTLIFGKTAVAVAITFKCTNNYTMYYADDASTFPNGIKAKLYYSIVEIDRDRHFRP